METDKNFMPRVELFPRLAAVGRFIVRSASMLPPETNVALSTHIQQPAEQQE